MENLTSLQNVKDWLKVQTVNDDALLTRLIGNSSRFILSYLQRRTFLYSTNNEIRNGDDSKAIFPRPFPLIALTAVTIDNQSIPVLSPTDLTDDGAILEQWNGIPPGKPQAIRLRGYRFCRGRSNVNLQYTSGYIVQKEAQTITSISTGGGTEYQATVNAPYGNWAADIGVYYASSGTQLTLVTSSPSAGQYSVSSGIYNFNAADNNAAIQISYSFIPADIEEACIELVAERYAYKGRIGEVSKSLGGQQTASYSQKAMPDFIRMLLQPYMNVNLG